MFSNFIKRLQHRYFPVKFAKFLRTLILKNICKQLPLNFKGNFYVKFDFYNLDANLSISCWMDFVFLYNSCYKFTF